MRAFEHAFLRHEKREGAVTSQPMSGALFDDVTPFLVASVGVEAVRPGAPE